LLSNEATKKCITDIFGGINYYKEEGIKNLDLDSKNIGLALFNVECTFLGMIQFFIAIAGTIALFMFVYGGMQYFFSLRNPSGDPSGEGHKTFYRAAMGLLLMVMAHIIMSLVISGFTIFTP